MAYSFCLREHKVKVFKFENKRFLLGTTGILTASLSWYLKDHLSLLHNIKFSVSSIFSRGAPACSRLLLHVEF